MKPHQHMIEDRSEFYPFRVRWLFCWACWKAFKVEDVPLTGDRL